MNNSGQKSSSIQDRDLTWLCEQIVKIEQELDLVNWTVYGYHPWVDLKQRLFEIAKTEGLRIMQVAHPDQFVPTASTPKLNPSLIDEYVKNRKKPSKLVKLLPRNKTAIRRGGRKQTDGTDLYTHSVEEALGKHGFVLDETAIVNDNHLADPRDSMAWINLATQEAMLDQSVLPVQLKKRDIEKAQELQNRFKETFLADPGDIVTIVLWFVRYTKLFSGTVADYLRKKQVANLVLVDSVGRSPLIHGARMAGVTTIELQHGVLGPLNAGYSWPNTKPTFGIPDAIFTFGDYWQEVTPLAMPAHTIGAPWINSYSANREKEERLIFVASQGPIAEPLFRFIVQAARELPEYEFIFHLHPTELMSHFEGLAKETDPPHNLQLSESSPGKTYELLTRSEFSVGVYSTSLFEGMAMGCRTIAIRLPGVEFMYDAAARGDVMIVDTPREFAERINEAPICNEPHDYFAPPVLGKALKSKIRSV